MTTTENEIQTTAAKPLPTRAELRKIIQSAAAKFDERVIVVDATHTVGVGSVKIEFDEQDPERLAGVLRYNHGQPARGNEDTAILDALCNTIRPEVIGHPVELLGASSNSVNFVVDWRIRCAA